MKRQDIINEMLEVAGLPPESIMESEEIGESTDKQAAVREFLRIVKKHPDAGVRKDYSGRGMYGKTCVGVRILPDIAHKLMRKLKYASSDSMGMGTIIYFPGVSYRDLPAAAKRKVDGLVDDDDDMDESFGIMGEAVSRHGRMRYSEAWGNATAQWLAALSVEMRDGLEKHGYKVTKITQSEIQPGSLWVHFEPDQRKGPPKGFEGPQPSGEFHVRVNSDRQIQAGLQIEGGGFTSAKVGKRLWNQTPADMAINIVGSVDDKLGTYF